MLLPIDRSEPVWLAPHLTCQRMDLVLSQALLRFVRFQNLWRHPAQLPNSDQRVSCHRRPALRLLDPKGFALVPVIVRFPKCSPIKKAVLRQPLTQVTRDYSSGVTTTPRVAALGKSRNLFNTRISPRNDAVSVSESDTASFLFRALASSASAHLRRRCQVSEE